MVEEWKWRGVPVWEHDGMICTGETYKSRREDDLRQGRRRWMIRRSLFNSSLEGNTRRAIDIGEGEKINEKALKTLIRAAVAFNQTKKKKPPAKKHLRVRGRR